MFGQKTTASTGFGSNNTNTATGGGLFGNNNASTSTAGSLFGNNNSNTSGTATTGLFGNNNNATNTTATTGSLFGNTNNSATNGAASTGTTGTSFGFGQNQTTTPSTTTLTPSFGFGTNSNSTATNTTSSLFGSNTQPKPLFGGSGAGTTGSLFGGSTQTQQQPQSQYTFGNNQTSSSLFGGNVQNQGQNQVQQGQSLFKKSSLFSVSSSDADAAKFKDLLNSQSQQFNQNQNQNQVSLFSNNTGLTNSSNSALTLGPQASLTLDTGLRKSTTPSWAAEKPYINKNTNNKHASSFNTADRGHIAVRKASLSSLQSPVSSFGTSFSGVSKPSHTKKKAIIQEDPPPTRSIYDIDVPSSLTISHKPDASSSSLAPRSATPSTGAQIANAGRPKAADHSLSVVIFGFPSSVTPAVVAHFSKFGNIAENVDSSNRIPIMSTPTNKNFRAPPTPIQTGKNWLKITYDNPASASRAIQENGTIIAGQFVVGCIAVTAQNYKEFEIASEKSIYSGAPSTVDEIEDSIVERNIPSFTEVSSSENTTEDNKTSQTNNRSLIGKNSSLPSLAGSKKVVLKDGKSIFNKVHKQSGYTGSFFKTPDAKKSVSAVKNNNAPNSENEGDKRLQSAGGQGWISWTSKKAQELVFGWDDL